MMGRSHLRTHAVHGLLLLAACLAVPGAADADTSPLPRFLEGLSFSGEVRVMYDAVFTDTTSGVSDRGRGRIGLLLGLKKEINPFVSASVRFATGTNANPVFPFVSFDNAATGKAIVIDHAFLDVAPLGTVESLPEPLRTARIVLGKQPTPFRYLPSFVWDPDLSLEGVAEIVKFRSGRWAASAAAGQFIFEDNAAPDDPYMLSHTLGIDRLPASPSGSRCGGSVGLHHVVRPYGIDATFQSLSNPAAGQHASPSGFSVLEASGYFIRFFGHRPVRLAGGYACNLSAAPLAWAGTNEDEGWIVDLTVGQATSKRGSWEIGGGYRVIEADACLGQFTDFAGTPMGATDAQAWFLHGVYMPRDNVSISSVFLSAEPESLRRADHLQRIEVQLGVKF